MISGEDLDSEEVIKELCMCNGLNFEKINQEGPATGTLEMFFSGYPKMVGLSYFPNLTRLVLVGQHIERIEGLESCRSLQELWVTECRLTEIEGLQHCPQLKKLYLYHNDISKIEGLGPLTELEVLWLNDNEIEAIEGLDNLQNLKELNLAGNFIHSIGQCLDPNAQLERLNLSGNKISSFTELTNLARLANLKDLGLQDPEYEPNPVCLLCNYTIHVLYHVPQLRTLDTYDVSSKQIKDFADSTVMKKMMYYNMRVKTIHRRLKEETDKLEQRKSKEKQLPEEQIKVLSFLTKSLEQELSSIRPSGCIQKNSPSSHGSDEDHCDAGESDRDEENQRKDSNRVEQILKKICALKERMIFWTQRLHEIEAIREKEVTKTKESFDLLVRFLQTELETVGNVRFEEGVPSDPWFKSCYDLILSRFCAWDFKAYGISGVKINRIVRVHNRILRMQFEDKMQELMENEDLGDSENHRKMFEYLFHVFDPKFPVEKENLLQVLVRGFRDNKVAKLYEQEQDSAVLLANSVSFCEGSRLECLQKQQSMAEKTRNHDPESFKYGKLVICKVFLGHSVIARENVPIKPENYFKSNSVFRPRKHENSNLYPASDGFCSSEEHAACSCSSRQCEWFVFDGELALPEYVVDFEFVTQEDSTLFSSPTGVRDLSRECESDEELLKMEPVLKPKPKLITLDEKSILSASKSNIYSQITVLDLHGNRLSKLKDIFRLNALRKLIISFNEFSSLEDISYVPNLEYVDCSHNRVTTLEGLRGCGKLQYLDLRWNRLTKTREEINILHKQAAHVRSLHVQNNPWQEPALVRKIAIGRLKSLTQLDGKLVTEKDISESEDFYSGSRISQLSLLARCGTDPVKPRRLSLLPSPELLTSRDCLSPSADLSVSGFHSITSLNFDGQNLFRLSHLEKLENLRWASFSNNHLSKTEGLERCVNLEELYLDGNRIATLEGLSKLTKLRRLSINNNQLTSFDRDAIDNLSHLHFLSAENNGVTSLVGLQKAFALLELYLSHNKIASNQEVYSLKGLSNLVILDLYGNPLVKPDNYRLFVIFHLPALKALDGTAVDPNESESAKDVFGGRLTSDMIAEKIGHQNFTELQELNWRSSSIRSVDLLPVDHFRRTHTVNLENNNLTSFSGLIFLSNVKNLYLNHNRIESLLPRQKSQHHLTNRQILHQKVTSSGYGQSKGSRDALCGETLAPVMPSLEVLHLGYNGISGLPQLQLSRLPNLKSLHLPGNDISQVEGLEGLRSLRELALDHNRIKLIGENSFAETNSLLCLNLEENRLRDLGNLSPLNKLQKLFVGFNKLQEMSEIDKLEAIPTLLELSVSGNPMSRKTFHRQLVVLRLQNLQVLDGVAVTQEERARAEMHYLEQQALAYPNSGMDVAYPAPTLIMSRPHHFRVTNVCLSGGVHHFVGADVRLNSPQDNILQNEASKHKKHKHQAAAAAGNPRAINADAAFRQLRGGANLAGSYLTPQAGQARAPHAYPGSQGHEARTQGYWNARQNQM
ncbi:leucine-rich repeat-containing protein 9 [Spea bombifrons]|uniref:leucine-rich repeat-containing protein 9 n=1 Tax=Spea bombifrons TaxID=233779 RepID=UPI00234A8CC7|nr:leucine-rich repeat-containing protein 9 [Spea bombifrons]